MRIFNLGDFVRLAIALVGYSYILASSGCSAQGSGVVMAHEIPGPGGVICFAIYNGSGDAVGGNCK